MQLSSFLRTVLKLDAASCLAMAASLIGTADLLSPLFGLPIAMLTEAAILLILVGLFILWLGTRERSSPTLVRVVVFGNGAWAAASFVSLGLVPSITGLGLAAVCGQAVAVLSLAALEWRGLRESLWASPA